MEKRLWEAEEDYIVLRYYLKHVDDWKCNLEELMAELAADGYERDLGSVKMRLGNYQHIHTGEGGLSHPAKQSKRIYDVAMSMPKGSEGFMLAKSFASSHFNPKISLSVFGDGFTFNNRLMTIDYKGPRAKPFFDCLVELMDKKGFKKDSDVYNAAMINRGVFSDWRCGRKNPERDSVMKLCLGMGLTLDEANELMKCGGFFLTNRNERDCYIIYGLEKRWDVVWVDEALRRDRKPGLIGKQLD